MEEQSPVTDCHDGSLPEATLSVCHSLLTYDYINTTRGLVHTAAP